MKRNDEEFALLLEGINGIQAGMAANLLEEEGIPSMRHGPDFDVGEFGSAAHEMLRGTSLFVPPSALDRSRQILAEAGWGEELGGEELGGEEKPSQSSSEAP